jgi:hypothetical protein
VCLCQTYTLSLPHARNDEDILRHPEIPSIIAGCSAHVIDQISRVNRDPQVSLFSSFNRIEIDLGFYLRVILSHPLSHLLSRTANLIFVLDSRAHGFFPHTPEVGGCMTN